MRVVAHLGQSLDGKIATACGHSAWVTGPEDLDHTHRLRALVDAVVVGAGTVAADDPQLTVRRVAGRSPGRVVIDTERRLGAHHRLFQDGAAPTLAFCRHERVQAMPLGRAVIAGLAAPDGRVAPAAVLAALAQRGVRRVLVEGGGVTVARFLEAGCLDRLELCIAPLVIGAGGRPALPLPEITSMAEARHLTPRVMALGRDWLFACPLERGPSG